MPKKTSAEPLREMVEKIPSTPGVYLMKDRSGEILYVGKAKSLHKRVRSYLSVSPALPKIKVMNKCLGKNYFDLINFTSVLLIFDECCIGLVDKAELVTPKNYYMHIPKMVLIWIF